MWIYSQQSTSCAVISSNLPKKICTTFLSAILRMPSLWRGCGANKDSEQLVLNQQRCEFSALSQHSLSWWYCNFESQIRTTNTLQEWSKAQSFRLCCSNLLFKFQTKEMLDHNVTLSLWWYELVGVLISSRWFRRCRIVHARRAVVSTVENSRCIDAMQLTIDSTPERENSRSSQTDAFVLCRQIMLC